VSPEIAAQFDRAAEGPITVDITTIGRNSGAPRRIEIWIVKVDDRIVIGGTPGPRDWLANLQADPRLTVHLKDDLVADVDMTATEVTDPARRRHIWDHPTTQWYRGQISLDELVAHAPTVECRLR
jgi:deazaflavin-dependent oxidoreductase (nitroreductase family)